MQDMYGAWTSQLWQLSSVTGKKTTNNCSLHQVLWRLKRRCDDGLFLISANKDWRKKRRWITTPRQWPSLFFPFCDNHEDFNSQRISLENKKKVPKIWPFHPPHAPPPTHTHTVAIFTYYARLRVERRVCSPSNTIQPHRVVNVWRTDLFAVNQDKELTARTWPRHGEDCMQPKFIH